MSIAKYAAVFLLTLVFAWGVGNPMAEAQNKQPRTKTSFNDGWQFTLDELKKNNWQPVDIPHTWNDEDPFDEEPGYLRTIGWYRKPIDVQPEQGKKYILKFEAANQITEVYVNGQQAGSHVGGYTAFTVDITPYLTHEKDTITVKVDNRHNEDVPPLKGDFNFYGGIYRDVWLVELNDVHFDFGDYAASGIFVTTPEVSESSASVSIKAKIKNETAEKQDLTITHQLLDPQGKQIAERESQISLESERNSFSASFDSIQSPRLWHPDHPNLYTLVSEIKNEKDILDRISTPFGFRWFRFDADSGFYLNGEHMKLMGVNRHQDYKGKGNALSNARHKADMKLAKATGANFLRTAHYPQDPAILTACDELGMLVSMEIPIDHEITDSKAFYENSVQMQREMIRQHFNSPSIIIWAYMNEMLLGRNWEDDREDIKKITAFARKMEDLTRREDSTRYTMIPNHGNFELYHKAELTEIPMIVGWNLYYGWYEAELDGLGKFLDQHHQTLPEKPAIITEYGAGSDPRIRTHNPIRFDFSIEWQNRFLQGNLRQIMERPFVAGAAVWNLFDFGSESRNDAVPQINSKGLMTFDRQPKDAYYLLQSWLKDEPFVRIGSREWKHRVGKVSDIDSSVTVVIYGNNETAELFLNDKSLGVKSFENHIARWEVPFKHGKNYLRVESDVGDKTISDQAVIDFNLFRSSAAGPSNEFKDIYINSGSNFYFTDETNGIMWHPDESYHQGFWGYKGGEVFQPRNRGIGIDADILGTDRDPLFQTQRVSPQEYVIDAPTGEYEITVLMARLRDDQAAFDVIINGTEALTNINLNEYEKFRAVEKKTIIQNRDDQITISFDSRQGEPVINGIEIRKIN